jgi:hypothetical protein
MSIVTKSELVSSDISSNIGLLIRGNNKLIEIPEGAYEIADAMLEARNKEPEQEVGIVAAKTRRRK